MELPESLVDSPDGEIRLRGSRVSLTDLVRWFRDGASAEVVATNLPTLPPAQIRDVEAFYGRHREQVDAILAREDAAIARYRAEAGPQPTLDELRGRLAAKKARIG